MNIYKLLGGLLLTVILFILAPYAAAHYKLIPPLADKAFLILLVTSFGLVVKSIVGDVVSGEFLFHKFGYDNCVMTFGALLTALALQIMSTSDLFPGMSNVMLLSSLPAFTADPAVNRSAHLVIFLLMSLAGTLLTGTVSAAIKKNDAKGPNFLSLLNSSIGLFLLGLYVLLLITKG
jgi:hypothetical protein